MKIIKKLVVISFFCMTLTSLFLIPITSAQEVVYDGANTQRFPDFSMYPSERYEINTTYILLAPPQTLTASEEYYRYDLERGNESDFTAQWATDEEGYSIWGKRYKINATSGLIKSQTLDAQCAFWNESLPFNGYREFIPVDSSGKVSASILNAVADTYYKNYYQYYSIYPNIYSLRFWNGTGTDIYATANYTDDGILINCEIHETGFAHLESALMSQPAQLPPVFSFTTASGILTVSSSRITLDLTVPFADNNNDGAIDTAYEYRVLESGIWSDWAGWAPSIEYNIGSVPAGNYTLTVEVKNMYGITQEQIEVEYIPSSEEDAIPGYSTVLIMAMLAFSVSILLIKYRKKK